jgi:hypothetical protein
VSGPLGRVSPTRQVSVGRQGLIIDLFEYWLHQLADAIKDLCHRRTAIQLVEHLQDRNEVSLFRGPQTAPKPAKTAALDLEIAGHLRSMARQVDLPPLPPRTRQRGRKPHDRVLTCGRRCTTRPAWT